MRRLSKWLQLGGRTSVLALAAIIMLGAAGALAATQIGSEGSDPGLQHAASVDSISPDLAADVAAFQRQAQPEDALPEKLKTAIQDFAPQFGAQPALARRAAVRHGASIYLVPSQDGVCFVQSDTNELFCSAEPAVRNGSAFALDLCSPKLPSDQIEIAGIIPDGATDVQARMTDNTSETVDASGGVYSARFAREGSLPEAIEWNGPDGKESVSIDLPKDTSSMKCVNPKDMPPPSELPAPPEDRTAPTVP